MPSAISELQVFHNWVKDHDQLFVISYSGENEELCNQLEQLRLVNDKLTITSLTTIKESRLSSLSDFSLYFQPSLYSEKADYKKWGFSPAYVLIDMLINGYCEWLEREAL